MKVAKKIVRYRGKLTLLPNGKAWLTPVDHPDGTHVVNLEPAMTSTVVSLEKGTGRLETKNTIYLPEEATNAG